ncbi:MULTISPECIES: hypothetical protein [unclassified Lysinibacillus]|uniref:hypothetical protein n=1 Tax=unclassified Lysinibacillus TaxID=2636778 RepID=UPI0025A2E7DC|nr:hypothetical protein [Lysinibacillus sp. G4S2]MDM5246217.1 hypothetical protein [Lysinibacillus sp. G4S2]
MEKTTVTFSLVDTVDALEDIREILENAHYVQQLVEEKFFGRCDVEEADVQLGIVHDYHRYGVFNRILSDNVYHAETLLKDLLHTVKITLQDS